MFGNPQASQSTRSELPGISFIRGIAINFCERVCEDNVSESHSESATFCLLSVFSVNMLRS